MFKHAEKFFLSLLRGSSVETQFRDQLLQYPKINIYIHDDTISWLLKKWSRCCILYLKYIVSNTLRFIVLYPFYKNENKTQKVEHYLPKNKKIVNEASWIQIHVCIEIPILLPLGICFPLDFHFMKQNRNPVQKYGIFQFVV